MNTTQSARSFQRSDMSAQHTPRPTCPLHKRPMLLRPVASQTPEQRWCGVWFDCSACGNSVLVPSQALRTNSY